MAATPEPTRVHPMFRHELERLMRECVAREDGLAEVSDIAAWVCERLEEIGWRVQPSHQRRHQIERGVDV